MARRVRPYQDADESKERVRCPNCGWEGLADDVPPFGGSLADLAVPGEQFPAGDCPSCDEASVYPVVGTGESDATRVQRAVQALQDARDLLVMAGCPKAAERVRLALSSTKGARRNVGYRRVHHEYELGRS